MKKVTKKYHILLGKNLARYEAERELTIALERPPESPLTFEKLANAPVETFEYDALEKEDVEKAISDHLGRPVTLSEVDCTVVYWTHSAENDFLGDYQNYPDGVGLEFQIGDDSCDDWDLFLDEEDEENRYWNGTEISGMNINVSFPFPDEIFAFDASEFKSFKTEMRSR